MRSTILSLLLIGLAFSSVFAQRNLKDIPDPDPLLQLAELEVAPEFEITLYAADPRIAKPIQMNFDPAGRLWVASSEVYPQIEPGQVANDKILVIEDQDHDGVADTTTVFADGLLIPTGVEPGDGGAYIANSTELLHLTDTDGDGIADHERVMLSGFGTEDTHHILHTLRWGPDGMLYMNQSIYIHSHIETPYGVRRMNGSGVWHFRPEAMQLEAFTHGLVNPWGHAFDPYGQSFETDGAGGEGINYVFPGFVGITSPGAKYIFHGLNPGKPKLCGLEMLGGSHIPEAWRGDLITNDFRAHRVCRYKLTDDGAGFAAQELDELVRTRHQAFRPIDVKLGPDGAIYIADWYNPIIQHGEVDFRDPRRDHTHGRIWRIAAKDRPLLPYQNLYEASTEELLEILKGDEPYLRKQARRVLKERGGDAVMPYMRILRNGLPERAKLEALWVYQSLDIVNAPLLTELLQHQDPRIRAAACRVLYHWQDRVPNKLALLQAAATDEHPRVRMEAAHALRKSREANAVVVAMSAMEKPVDRFMNYALLQTADQTSDKWLPALRAGKLSFDGNTAGLLFALNAADTADAVSVLLNVAESWKDDPSMTRQVMTMVASRGSADQLSDVVQRTVSSDDASLQSALLTALISAARNRKLRPAGDLNSATTLLQSRSAEVQANAAELLGLWQMKGISGKLFAMAGDSNRPLPTRLAAVRGLAAMKDSSPLVSLDADKNPAAVRMASISGLATFDANLAAKAAAALLPKLSDTDDPTTLVRAFLAQEGGDAALSGALAKHGSSAASADVVKLAIRAARTSGREVGPLVEQLRKAAGLSETPPALTAEQRTKLLADVMAQGDPSRGEEVYRRAELNCQKCHGIGGAGGLVGPDLASIGASAPADYILESMLDPGAKIKENYHSQIVATDEGQVLTGILLRETNDALILRDAEDRELSIPLDSIEERKDGGSLMPAGLLNELTRQETLDLLRFLTELGKIGDFALPRQIYVRTWESLAPDVNRGLLRRRSEPEIAVDGRFQWNAAYSKVAGNLPLAEQPVHQAVNADSPARYLRFPIDVPANGNRTLKLSQVDGVRLYVDGKRTEASETVKLSLPQGKHSVMLAVDQDHQSPISVAIE